MPEAFLAFLNSHSREDAARNAIFAGGDSDTPACITGGIAEAFYGPVEPSVLKEVRELFTKDPWEITERFVTRSRKYELTASTRKSRAPHLESIQLVRPSFPDDMAIPRCAIQRQLNRFAMAGNDLP